MVLFVLLCCSSGEAATLTVTSAADSGAGTLRNQIAAAAAGDTINFSLTYPATITLSSTLTIDKNLSIAGPGASRLTISGGNAVRIFNISAGAAVMSDIALANGRLANDNGAAVTVANGASLTVNRGYIHSNTVTSSGGYCSEGAAFNSFGTLTINSCTISNNQACAGAAVTVRGGSATLTNCTVSGNYSTNQFGGDNVVTYASLTIINSTITGNTADYYEAGLGAWTSASVTLKNTIIAGNTSANPSGDSDIFFDSFGAWGGSVILTTQGYNLIGSEGSQNYAWSTGDVVGEETAKQDPGLNTTLADNGGYSRTHALNAASQAINPANSNGSPFVDQRGYLRNGNSDKGSHEYGGTLPVATAATGIGATSFSANWNAASGAAGYRLDVATDSAFTSFVSGYNDLDAGNVTTASVTGLTTGTTYYYRIRAYSGSFLSYHSNTITVTSVPPPTVTGVSPSGGPITGGTSVTITGTNFTGATAVMFGGTSASTYTVDSATQITATSPAGSAGAVDVTVTTAGGTSATGPADQFTYVALPDLTMDDVSLSEGSSGTTIFTFTVSLSSPAGAGGVTFDIATADNTASAPGDYIAKSLTGQTIPAGSSTYTFDVSINGDIAPEANETFFVNVTNVTGANVTDGQGRGTITNDDVLPTVTSVSVPASGTYVAGQNFDFTVNFSASITVNTGGGTPYLQISLDTGGTVNASYISGSGTNALVFRYTVAAGNEDTNEIGRASCRERV